MTKGDIAAQVFAEATGKSIDEIKWSMSVIEARIKKPPPDFYDELTDEEAERELREQRKHIPMLKRAIESMGLESFIKSLCN